ncbi:MAG: PH domain-containing protein [Candidatus Heimdallarchaeaceae archaeon]
MSTQEPSQFPKVTEWVIKAINSEIRRKILRLIYKNEQMTYTELLDSLKISTGKLNFHIRQLTGLVEKVENKFYVLTELGNKALALIGQLSVFHEKAYVNSFQNLKGIPLYAFKPPPELKKKQKLIATLLFAPIFVTQMVFLILIFTKNLQLRNVELQLLISSTLIGIVLFCLIYYLIGIYYKSIEYEISETELCIKKGIVTKNITIIPYRTVTNLILRRGPFDRIFGISTLIIETAGESGNQKPEGTIAGVCYPDELVEEILNHVRRLDPPKYIKEVFTEQKGLALNRSLLLKISEALEKIDGKLSQNEQ